MIMYGLVLAVRWLLDVSEEDKQHLTVSESIVRALRDFLALAAAPRYPSHEATQLL